MRVIHKRPATDIAAHSTGLVVGIQATYPQYDAGRLDLLLLESFISAASSQRWALQPVDAESSARNCHNSLQGNRILNYS